MHQANREKKCKSVAVLLFSAEMQNTMTGWIAEKPDCRPADLYILFKDNFPDSSLTEMQVKTKFRTLKLKFTNASKLIYYLNYINYTTNL